MKLYIDTKKVYAARERQKELLEKKECTFKPKINASVTAYGSKTTRKMSNAEKLYRKLEDMQRVKQKKLED